MYVIKVIPIIYRNSRKKVTVDHSKGLTDFSTNKTKILLLQTQDFPTRQVVPVSMFAGGSFPTDDDLFIPILKVIKSKKKKKL